MRRLRRLSCLCISAGCFGVLVMVVHMHVSLLSDTKGSRDVSHDTRVQATGSTEDETRPKPQSETVELHEYWPGAVWRDLQWMWQPNASPVSVRTSFKIVYWTPQYKNPIWFGLGNEPFVRAGCPIYQCETTNDTSAFSSSDVILIHQAALKKQSLPKVKLPGQKWILNMAESPVYDTRNWVSYNGFFEGLADYRLDADIPRLPGYFKRKPLSVKEDQIDYAVGKNQATPVAWFVSHCETHSKRERYAKELQRYIQVDVYGKCGKKTCQRPLNNHSPDNDPCMDMLHKQYKFYLSFENSICRDYITEKAWLLYVHQMNIVPVVLGGANYSRLFPPHSYIDVLDFESPRHLAQHLHKLNEDDHLYNEYFAWRNRYSFKKAHTLPCGICSYLHLHAADTSVHKDLVQWKSRQKHCLDPAAYYGKRLTDGR